MPESRVTLAALQIGSAPGGTAATVAAVLEFERQISELRPQLLVMPEALLGGYPKGATFGAQLGFRTAEGREQFRLYHEAAVDMDGEEIAALCGLAQRSGASIVCGVIERDRSTLYCTAIFVDPQRGVVAKRRKLLPTGTERLIWGRGDGSTLSVVDTAAGRVTAALCWENYMPLFRTALYAKGVDIWCAPTVDCRDAWQATMRHIALEGRCFVVSACQVQSSPADLNRSVENWPADRPLMSGGSVIVGPLGDVLAGPLFDSSGLVSAVVDLADIPRSRFDFDVVGHYSRPDVFRLSVDEREQASVTGTSGYP